jgi:acyl carrier protein
MDSAIVPQVAHREDVLARVRQLILESVNVSRKPDELDPDIALFGSGLGLDSIDAVEIVVALDTTFGVRLADNVFGRAEMRTINGLVDLVLAAEADGGAANGTT